MQDLDKIIHRLQTLGKDWAEKEAAASWLEESRKTVRAQMAVDYIREAGSAAKAELLAEADPIYKEHLKVMVEARKTANIAKVNYEAGKTWVELSRTKEATKRAELKALGG